VREEIVDAAQRRRLREVRPVRRGDDVDVAELLRDQRRLRRPHHAHRDVGLAAEQIGELVRRDQLDLDLGCARCNRARTAGSSQVAATWLVVTRTTPRDGERAPARPRVSASAPSAICRAASAIASARRSA
jgi:hypothetical protein